MTTDQPGGVGHLPDDDALERAIDMVHRWLAARLDGDHHTAQDLTAKTLCRYVRKVQRFPDWRADNLEAWLTDCARKVLLSHVARQARQATSAPGADELERAADELARRERDLLLTAYAGSAEEDVDRRLDLRRAIARLPEDERTALIAHEFEKRTYEQIGLMMGTSESTAERTAKRAARRLARSGLLEAYGPTRTATTGGRP